MKEIPLTGKHGRGLVTRVDDGDLELVSKYRWRIHKVPKGVDYVVTYMPNPDRKGKGISNFPMHRLLLGDFVVDHRNGDTLDNQRHNLRPATYAQNAQNRRPHSGTVSGFKGVHRPNAKMDRWQARIMKDGQRICLGNFDTPEEAARVYDAAARTLFGEFAWLNFPGDLHVGMPAPAVRQCARPDCGEEVQRRLANAIYCSPRCAAIMSKRRVRARRLEAA